MQELVVILLLYDTKLRDIQIDLNEIECQCNSLLTTIQILTEHHNLNLPVTV